MTEKGELNRQNQSDEQKLLILDRKIMNISGVLDVVSFDETGAVLRTSLGTLTIDGEELHVVKLDLGNGSVVIEGKINGIFYSEAGGAKNRAKRLFR